MHRMPVCIVNKHFPKWTAGCRCSTGHKVAPVHEESWCEQSKCHELVHRNQLEVCQNGAQHFTVLQVLYFEYELNLNGSLEEDCVWS